MDLNPTLWRTCRVLTGPTRLRLLRLVLTTPGLTVSRLAAEAGISLSRASQELRRLQSRGLLGVERQGPFVRYLSRPDPQVPSAGPLLQALKATFAQSDPAGDETIIRTAFALAHPRRISILRKLLDGPATIAGVSAALDIPFDAVFRHLRALRKGQLVLEDSSRFRPARPNSPLAKCLVKLVKSSP